MKDISLHQAEQVQRLAQEYASYSASKSGLGKVLGGLVGSAVYLINGLLGRSLWTTILTILFQQTNGFEISHQESTAQPGSMIRFCCAVSTKR